MYRSLFSRDIFSELDRLQRFANQAFEISPSIRGVLNNRFPAINVGTSPQEVEIQCFAPGIDPAKLEVKLEKGVLSIVGERKDDIRSDAGARANIHIGERFAGRFHRVVTLPDDVDGNSVTATYRDGVVRIKASRREAAQPRRITIQ